MRFMLVATLTLAGCNTVFMGSAKVLNGPAGCRKSCEVWGMELAGMVKMGEYSDGCICQVRQAGQAAAAAPSDAGSVIPPATGVVMQMQAQANAAAGGAAAQQGGAVKQQGSGSYGGYGPRR